MTVPSIRLRRLLLAAPVLACMLLASCAGLIGPREVEVPLVKLQAGLERRFPLHQPLLELFDVQMSRPQLSLPEGGERVAIALDLNVAPPFLKQSYSGQLALSGR